MSALALSPDAVASLARRLFGDPNRRLSTAREMRFGRRGSLAVVPSRGVFRDYETGVSGGLFDMVVHAGAAATRAEAAKLLEQGGELPQRETERERTQRQMRAVKERTAHLAAASALWKAAGPVAGTVAETYFRRARAVSAPLEAAALRFLPDAPFTPYAPDRRRYPAIIAAVVNAQDRFTGCHATYLRPDGRGKADVTPARKMVGTVAGGHVRLIPSNRLVVGEGMESALSAWEAAATAQGSSMGDLGAVAALSAGGLIAFEWPIETTALIIAPDHDASGTGERAAQALARRAWAAGLVVSFLRPPEGFTDWNDAAQSERVRL